MKKKTTISDLILYLHGASAFQLLHAGSVLGLFNLLHEKPLNFDYIQKRLKLNVQPMRCLLFGLVALGLIEKQEDKFINTTSIEELFSANQWDLFQKMILIQAHIMYPGQYDFVDSLVKNKNVGIKRYRGEGQTIYERLNYDKKLKQIFYNYMEAYSEFANPCLLNSIDFSKDNSILDVGGGGGINAISLAKKYPHLKITLFDLDVAERIAEEKIKQNNLSDRIVFCKGNMFKEDFPKNQDSILFIHQLVIWGGKENEKLLKKAYKSLKKNGRVIIFSSISDDSEDSPVMAALDTVYFRSVAAGDGMIYPWKDYETIFKKVGFKKFQRIRCNLWTPHGIILAYK